ncbi:MAG: SDR family oxidoreductase [Tannerella sp.]|jgi:3-oxoacyl-[acyl-carrier protein] reductase|nr:SDR family oxidoreductase [Tannerella sp.]
MKVAIVTGGSRGIGRAIALELAQNGYEVAITGRDTEQLKKVIAEIESIGQKGLAITADLTHNHTPEAIIKEATGHFKQLDVLVNCAGITMSGSFTDTGIEDWERIFNVNARAPFFLCKEAMPFLKKSKKAIIINIASVVGFKGYIYQSVYASSKHALTGFTKVLAKEVQPLGIRVHLISPGGVATEMVTRVRPDIHPEELIQPEEIAEIIRYIVNSNGNGIIDHFYIRRFSGLPFD